MHVVYRRRHDHNQLLHIQLGQYPLVGATGSGD
jgi:hypothetical protein